jgi:putative flippase GtrA
VFNPRTDELEQRPDSRWPSGDLSAGHLVVPPGCDTRVDRDTLSPIAKGFIPQWLIELIGYGFASLAALSVDTWILRALVKVVGWHYLPASIASFISGAAVAYLLSTWFVFRSHRVTNHALEFGYFLALGVVGLGVNTLVLWISIGGAGLGLITSKLLAAVCTFITNFVLRRWLLFSRSRKENT